VNCGHNAAVGKNVPQRAQPVETMGVNGKPRFQRRNPMDAIIYLVGLVVVVMAILSFFGLR
jgi:hypothetical protein